MINNTHILQMNCRAEVVESRSVLLGVEMDQTQIVENDPFKGVEARGALET